MFGDAIRFPLSGDEGVKSVIIGGVLGFFSFLLLPIFPLQGYFVRVAKASAEGSFDAPAFDEWGDLIVDGVKVFVVTIAYFIIPTLLFIGAFVVIGIGSIAVGGGVEDPGAVTSGVSVVGAVLVLVTLLVYLVFVYIYPAGIVNMARRDDIGAAFDFSTVLGAAFTADYFIAGVLAILLALVVGVLTIVLSALTFGLFLLLGVFVQFYVQVAFFYLFGRGYAKALGLPSANNRV
jgi:hypothetical protein